MKMPVLTKPAEFKFATDARLKVQVSIHKATTISSLLDPHCGFPKPHGGNGCGSGSRINHRKDPVSAPEVRLSLKS